MLYTPPIGGAADDPYVDANPALGIEGSAVPAAAIEGPMSEIINVITAAGLTPNSGDLTQLRQAIAKMIQGGQRSVIVDGATFAPAVAGTGKAVYWDSANSRFDLALSDGTAKQNCVGFADVANGKVYVFGDSVLFTGLTPGARYYLDATTAGAITTVAPSNGVLVGIARAATELFVDIDGLGVQASQVNTWTKGQIGHVTALPATTGTVTLDLGQSNNWEGTLTGNITLANPSTMPVGQSGIIRLVNGATPYTIAYGSSWKPLNGVSLDALTAAAGANDDLVYYIESATRGLIGRTGGSL